MIIVACLVFGIAVTAALIVDIYTGHHHTGTKIFFVSHFEVFNEKVLSNCHCFLFPSLFACSLFSVNVANLNECARI